MAFETDRRNLLRNSALWAAAIPVLPLSAETTSATGTAAFFFNVKEYGATGIKSADARPAIQKAIDACSAAGGGIVYLPPGEYTSGTLYLRSHVRLHIEGGAILYASKNPDDFNGKPNSSKAALLFGENLENVTIEGRGKVNGQSAYEWRIDNLNDVFVKPAKDRMKALGKSTLRTFPAGYPERTIYPHLVFMSKCTDIRITGLSFIDSPSWTMYFHQCDRLTLDGLYLYTKLNDAVWADGVDLDGCKDVCIVNSTIVTADDCIAIFSMDFLGAPRACENITIANCRFSSSSHAVKFTEGNIKGVHRVTISNCVITDDSSGFGLLSSNGGDVSDVIISNVVMNLRRFDWFWGQGGPFGFVLKRRDEWTGAPVTLEGPSPGSINNIIFRDMVIHAVGRCHINGHPASWINGLTIENIKLFLATDPTAPFDWTVNAMEFQYARNLKLRNIEIYWETPALDTWQSALHFENIEQLTIEGFEGRQAWVGRNVPAVVFKDVKDATVRDSTPAEGTEVFLNVQGDSSEICLFGNDFRKAKIPYQLGEGLKSDAVLAVENIGPAKPAGQ